ncbi:MAG: endonuclease V [Sphingomonadales bacterium]|nr:MAG: endonuclease V [Sphingomonadales bacterium]
MPALPPTWLAPATLREATIAQREIAAAVDQMDRHGEIRTIAGADTSSKWLDRHGPLHAALAPLRWPNASPCPPATFSEVPRFPYTSGYLGFREAPALIVAWDRLETKPDLLFVDGQGRAHPRRCGIACQLGVLLDIPAIGVAKTLLCGAIEGEVGPAVGDRAPLIERGEVIGVALRTAIRGRPVYVSIGHRVSLDSAVEWVLRLSEGRRLPLPIRLAHDASNETRRAWEAAATGAAHG